MSSDFPKILHENRLDDATPVASTTADGFNVLNLRDFRPYTKWKPTALPATVTVDSVTAKAVDYWTIHGHDLFTQAATIELRGSTDNFAASDVLVDSITPTSNNMIVRLIGSVSYRYWRLRITGTTMPTIAIASLGVALNVPSYMASGFDPIGRTIKGQYNRSELGHPLGRTVKYEEWEETLKFETLTWAWIRDTWLPAWRAHVRDDPFIFVWNPLTPNEAYLVAVKDKFSTPHKPGSYADLSFEVSGVAT